MLRVVDAHRAGLEAPRDRLAARESRVNTDAREPVGRVVGQADRLLGVGDLHHRQRRAERLLGHALHRVVDVDQHRRLEEAGPAPSARLPPASTRAPLSTASRTWSSTMSSCGGKVIAPTSTAPGPAGSPWRSARTFSVTLADELVVDRLLDVDALDRDADLAGVVHRVEGGGVGGALEVGVGEHDHRVLAAELER